MALSVKKTEQLIRSGEPGMYCDNGQGGKRGLYLDVRSKTSASWVFRYQRNHRTFTMGLGSAVRGGSGALSLEDARKAAESQREILQKRLDPISERDRQRGVRRTTPTGVRVNAVPTFQEAFDAVVKAQSGKWTSQKHADGWVRSMKHALEVLGDLPVDVVDRSHILKVLEPHWGSKPVTMDRVRSRIELVLSWAQAEGHRADNPAEAGLIAHKLPRPGEIAKVVHHPALDYRLLPALWGRLHQLMEARDVRAHALALVILTGARLGEIGGLCWSEVDYATNTLRIPAERMKMRVPHEVALSPTAIAVLKRLEGLVRVDGEDRVFAGIGPRFSKRLYDFFVSLLKQAGIDQKATIHGLRSTFRVWAAEQQASVPRAVVEAVLAHMVGSGVERAYQRSRLLELRRPLMVAWDSYVTATVANTQAAA